MHSPSLDTSEPNRSRILYRASAVVDARGVRAAPGCVLLDGRRIVAAGAPESIGAIDDALSMDFEDAVLMPALVNAHTHLDLTHIGPIPLEGDFSGWADGVRRRRETTEDGIRASAVWGADLLHVGGTALVGDIAGAGSLAPLAALREAGMRGVGFVEVFGLGTRQDAAIERLRAAVAEDDGSGGVTLGLQPHAPYSCGLEVYRAAAAHDAPMSTHLAETRDEIAFVRDAAGPIAEMLKRIGVWNDGIRAAGVHPIDHLAEVLSSRPVVAAHLNYVDDAHLDMLAKWPITVAYCPRASTYFGHTGHRYREMLDAGVDVALGTDSILCLDTPHRISVLDEMRVLYTRDGVDAATLLSMATTRGAAALGADAAHYTLDEGESAGIIAVPGATFDDAMRSASAPSWVMRP